VVRSCVSPGRSAAEGRGIHGRRAGGWIPFPCLRRVGDDTGRMKARVLGLRAYARGLVAVEGARGANRLEGWWWRGKSRMAPRARFFSGVQAALVRERPQANAARLVRPGLRPAPAPGLVPGPPAAGGCVPLRRRTVSGPTITTPRERAPRWTGHERYSLAWRECQEQSGNVCADAAVSRRRMKARAAIHLSFRGRAAEPGTHKLDRFKKRL